VDKRTQDRKRINALQRLTGRAFGLGSQVRPYNRNNHKQYLLSRAGRRAARMPMPACSYNSEVLSENYYGQQTDRRS
jgi:hypothetical protein